MLIGVKLINYLIKLKKMGINLRKSNNIYHIELKGISRYTESAVELLKKVKK